MKVLPGVGTISSVNGTTARAGAGIITSTSAHTVSVPIRACFPAKLQARWSNRRPFMLRALRYGSTGSLSRAVPPPLRARSTYSPAGTARPAASRPSQLTVW